MSPRKRVLAALGLSLAATAGVAIATLVLVAGGKRDEAPRPAVREALRPAPVAAVPEARAALAAVAVAAVPAAVPAPEAPTIEDILAEAGEDPGAVFYTSRVREAAREGNPRFARVLLAQMREIHPGSVLVEEAVALLEAE